MAHTEITRKRVRQFIDRIRALYYRNRLEMSGEVTTDEEPVPFAELASRSFRSIRPGEAWGRQWDSAWFRFTGEIPAEWDGREAVALIDTGSEACVFQDGTPWLGLTNRDANEHVQRKRRVQLGVVGGVRTPSGEAGTPGGHTGSGGERKPGGATQSAFASPSPGEPVEFLVEAAANRLFGAMALESEYRLREAHLALFDRDLWRIVLDLDYLYDLAGGLEADSVRGRRILAGLNEAANVWADGAGREQVRAIAADLLDKPANASALTAWSVGHAHLDLGWQWPVRETRRKGGRTFATQLRLLEEYPEYIFGASQPQLFEWMKHDYPALYEEIREAVRAGRIEPQGAMWVEPDMNLTSGESLVRQCLYGKRFFREEFGIDIRHLWLPDVFGYSAALPQILRGCGVDVFMTQKISWNEMNAFPHHTFVWEGIDGSRVRSHFLPANSYNFENYPSRLVAAERRFAEGDRLDDFLNLYGVGDGGGGPSREHIERGLRSGDTEGVPRVRFAHSEEYFERLRALPEEGLPLWRGELYLELHRGTYTTQALMKRYNRRLEHLLHDVELLAVLAGHDSVDVGTIWKETLLNQFHDILPGSSIEWVYRDAHAESARNIATLESMREGLLREILGDGDGRAAGDRAGEAGAGARGGASAKRSPEGGGAGGEVPAVRELSPAGEPVETGAGGVVLFNPLAWDREVVLSVDSAVHRGPGGAGNTASGGKAAGNADAPAPGDSAGAGARSGAGAAAAARRRKVRVPSTGFARISAEEHAAADAGAEAGELRADAQSGGVQASAAGLENALVRVALAEDGSITSIYRKDLDREYLAGGANLFLLWEDYPYSWDAWDISHYYRETIPQRAQLVDSVVESEGGLLGSVRLGFEVGNSRIVQLLSLEAGSPVLRADCRVDWREEHKHLRVAAETAIAAPAARYEIQYGAVERPTHENTSWDQARFEVPAQRFADLSRPDAGFAILNDCKYGHRIRGGDVELTLLRSPKSPDPGADIREHAFAFAYMPHGGERDRSAVLRAAHELNAPVVAMPVGSGARESTGGAGDRAAATPHRVPSPSADGSYFSVSSEAVKLEAIKPAEDGAGVVVRLYETLGSEAETELRVPAIFTEAIATNLLEEGDQALTLDGGRIVLRFAPFEIRTIRLR